MLDIENIFAHRQVNYERLLAYGFKALDDGYVLHQLFMDGQFEALIQIDQEGCLSEEVIDTLTREKYALIYQPYANGQFIGKVRDAYEKLLHDLADACFDKVDFKNALTQQVIAYIESTYGDCLEFPWGRDGGNAIVRHGQNRKWYVAILRVSKAKLGLKDQQIIDVLNVKNDPESIKQLIDGEHYFPAYHMHKKYWMSMLLDGTVSFEEICHWIDISYQLTQ